VVTLAGIDPVLLASAAAGLLLDLPGAVVVHHLATEGAVRRLVTDVGGVLEDVVLGLDHPCVACALREDLVPTATRLAGDGRWGAVVVQLPPAAEPGPLLVALRDAGLAVASCVAVVDAGRLERDVFGDDLLADRGAVLSEHDRRAVGEVLVRQLDVCDVVAVPDPPGPRAEAVLDHVVAGRPDVVDLLGPGTASRVLRSGDPEAPGRADPGHEVVHRPVDRHGVWTVGLRSWRPLHPARLRTHVAVLGGGTLRGRGTFWVPSRPGEVLAWDGAGGQLAVGAVGRWPDGAPATRLRVTGVQGTPAPVVEAFRAVLLTDAEVARGGWVGVPDGLDDWLGEPDGQVA
jgi:G3E family GTPase